MIYYKLPISACHYPLYSFLFLLFYILRGAIHPKLSSVFRSSIPSTNWLTAHHLTGNSYRYPPIFATSESLVLSRWETFAYYNYFSIIGKKKIILLVLYIGNNQENMRTVTMVLLFLYTYFTNS